ncbi:phage tail length tape measure family protein [Comamonas flocculans]|uniref:Bacteriophage tail tape measure N-terminal domain-containing protein n=1 Tax=Comamonas flocculans TaxID=2597701 RepID=A0A5B8RZM0_9BURK|nr:phage tail length tape measure family protein [Comamonas flocculans]QEA14278.1 hypothetical protein FOZ74_15255 [Comamonas flocculans]
MSNEFNVAVKVSADASQLTAELKRAGGALQEFTARAQGAGAGVTGALQSTTTAAQAMGAAVHSGAQAHRAGAQSAAQHADALRGAAAQVTNTVTALGGLAGQGAQAGAALGSTTGAVRALVTAAGVATTGLGALAIAGGALITAYARGSAEADHYRLAIVTTGNAAGTSVDQLAGYARQIASVSGTQAQAAETLAMFTDTGAVGTGMLREAAQAAIEWERATGQAASTTAAKFAALARDPLAATVKLNEGMNFLTTSTYQQIKALQEQGRTSDAAAAAQHALADAFTTRAGEIEANLGTIERGWRGVKDMAASAWDAMLNIGREGTKSDRLQALKAELAQHQAAQAIDTRGLAMESSASVMARRGQSERAQQIENEIAALEAEIGTEETLAQLQAKGAADRKLYFEWEKQGDALRTKAQRREQAIRSAEAEGQALLNAGLITEAQLRERIDAIRQKYRDRKSAGTGAPGRPDSELASLQAQLQAAQLYGEQLSTLGTAASALNAGERASLKIGEELKQVTDDKTAARLREKQAIADALGAQLRSNDGLQESLKAHQADIDANYADADAIEQRAKAQEAANATLGKSKAAIEEMTLAELKHQMAEAQGSDSFDPKYIASLERKIAAQERWVTALRGADYKAAEQHVNELLRGAEELSRAYADEQQLSGLTALEREKITAQRQVELKYAKELAAIDKMALSDAEKQALREIALQAKRKEGIAAVAKARQQAGAAAADEINRSLTDALMRGFESGKGFAQNLADTTRNLFNSMVLRPVISAIMTPVSLVVSGIVQQGLGAVGLGSTGTGVLGLASNASTAYNMVGALNGQGLLGGVGSTLFGNAAAYGAMTPGLALGGQQAAMLAAQTGEFGLAGATATAQAGGAGMGGFGALLSSPLAIAGGALLLGNALGLFRTTEKRGGGLIGTLGEAGGVHDADLMRKSGTLFGGPDWFVEDRGQSALDKAIQGSFDASKTAIKGFAESLGLATDTIDGFSTVLGTETMGDHGQLGIRLDNDGQPLSDAEVQAKIAAAIKAADNELAQQLIGAWQESTEQVTERVRTGFWDSGDNGGYSDVTRDVTTTTYTPSEFARDGEQAIDTLTRLGTSLQATGAAFTALGLTLYDASLAGGDMASQLVDAYGGIDAMNAALGAYHQNYYTDQERYTTALDAVRAEFERLDIAMPPSRAALRALIEGLDRTTESGRETFAALTNLSSAFAAVTPQLFDAGAELAGTIRSALLGSFDGASAGAAMAQTVQLGIYNAIAGQFANQITGIIVAGVVDPVIQAAITGSSVSAAVSSASIAQMVEQANAVASAAAQIMNDPAFEAAMRDIGAAVSRITIPVVRAAPAVNTYASAVDRSASAATKASDAMDAAFAALQRSVGAEKERAQTALESARALESEFASLFGYLRGAVADLRGQVAQTADWQAQQGWAFIDEALSAWRADSALPQQEQLAAAVDAVRRELDAGWGDTEFLRMVLANKLEELQVGSEAALSEQERLVLAGEAQVSALDALLDNAADQLAYAKGTYTALLALPQAIAGFNAAIGGKGLPGTPLPSPDTWAPLMLDAGTPAPAPQLYGVPMASIASADADKLAALLQKVLDALGALKGNTEGSAYHQRRVSELLEDVANGSAVLHTREAAVA